MKTRYLSAAETAKLVRRALKASFPGQKFSVRTKTYSGGASIDVSWTDGPMGTEVDAVVKAYEGSGFDGMIDLKYSRSHYLRPDGSVYVHSDRGTTGSGGLHESEDNTGLERLMPEGVQVVQFGADYIFTHRDITDLEAKKDEAIQWINENVDNAGHNGGYYRTVEMTAYRMVENRRPGESLRDAWFNV